MNSGVSSIGYVKSSSGPISRSTETVKGISTGLLPSTGMRQMRPPYDATTSRESGVNDMPGRMSREAKVSWSSR